MTDTPLARLDRMLGNAPHGQEAEALLQHLAVFHNAFHHADVLGMLPVEMSKKTGRAALAALISCHIIGRVHRWQYEFDPEIQKSLTVSEAGRAKAFTYFSTSPRLSDLEWSTQQADGFFIALLWGLEHTPQSAFEMLRRLAPNGLQRLVYSSYLFRRLPWSAWVRFILRSKIRLLLIRLMSRPSMFTLD
jgi:hypothetical protein